VWPLITVYFIRRSSALALMESEPRAIAAAAMIGLRGNF
jgi:hypothetical protein